MPLYNIILLILILYYVLYKHSIITRAITQDTQYWSLLAFQHHLIDPRYRSILYLGKTVSATEQRNNTHEQMVAMQHLTIHCLASVLVIYCKSCYMPVVVGTAVC